MGAASDAMFRALRAMRPRTHASRVIGRPKALASRRDVIASCFGWTKTTSGKAASACT